MKFNYNSYRKQVLQLAKVNFKHLFENMGIMQNIALINYKELRKIGAPKTLLSGQIPPRRERKNKILICIMYTLYHLR